jgi:uncharacterized protein involved in cysteine biosynthesis
MLNKLKDQAKAIYYGLGFFVLGLLMFLAFLIAPIVIALAVFAVFAFFAWFIGKQYVEYKKQNKEEGS